MPAIPSSRPSTAPLVSSKTSPSVTRTPVASKYPASSFTTPSSSSSTRPLLATKVVHAIDTARRRSVAFATDKNQTKEFAKDSPIMVPETAPPPSIRAYSPVTSSPIPSSDRASSPSRPRRPILKASDPSMIRVARTVREGSWANREPARRLVVGSRPRDVARSGSLAQLCDTAEDGVAGRLPSEDDMPGSDDSAGAADAPASDGSDEEPEEVECLHPTSLVNVILEGAEDLLTLEEAYTTLTNKVRELPLIFGPVTEAAQFQLDAVAEPISDEAPALVRAVTRDLSRLMGKVPQSEHSQSSTPFRGLMFERASTIRLPPSPSNSPMKKGYSEAEIRYRREASSVGAAALRFLAALYSSPRLFSSFTEGDLVALLEQVIMIPKTPVLPTPIPKRTYSLALLVLAHLRIPSSWVARLDGKIFDALDSAWNVLGTGGPPFAFKDSAVVKREAFTALSALLRFYPQIMVPGYKRYLATSLRALSAIDTEMRRLASAAISAFVKARYQLLADAELAVQFDRERNAKVEWEDLRDLVHRSELYAAQFFKTSVKPSPRRYNDTRPDNGQQVRTEWSCLEAAFKSLIGKQEDVAWACSTWAVVVTLMGSSYNSFPLGILLDHIMDRSLQPSSNTVRPALACTAWQHAIHAYLLAGSSCSISNGRMVRSFNPFTASSGLSATARVNRIMFPFKNAMQEALDVRNFARALVEFPEFRNDKRWTWKRSEKPRRTAYMISTGSIAPAIVFAYTTLALDHEDQVAREVSRLSGLPSSDGIVSDLTPEEQRLPRLDQTFELILLPILKQSFPICGVDILKTQAWSIFEAITAEPAPNAPRRSIDRLLSWRFLKGDVISLEATDQALAQELATAFEGDRIKPSEIPAWGKLWIAKRLGKLLALFVDAFDGISGINTLSSVDWVRNADGIVLLPKTLARVWTNLLGAMSITHVPDGPATPLFKVGLHAVMRTLLDIFDRDPAAYLPICLLNEEGQSTLSPAAIRLGVVMHLFRLAEEVLGERVLGTVQGESSAQQRAQDEDEAFGSPTVAGHLLKHILRSDLMAQMDDKTRERFMEFIGSLLRIGSAQNTRMLGHVANAMPWIFEHNERLQLDVWRTLALAWIDAVDLQPSDTAARTNYTGDLLVSLLSCPFRNENSDSVWYSNPADKDLTAWDSLLETTVLRFRAKRVGSNFGVLETLAAHLQDFAVVSDDRMANEARMTAPTTLHCLAVAASKVSFVPTEHYHASHFSINENYVPVDFLGYVSSALNASYPSAQPSAIALLISSIAGVFRALPADSVPDILEPLRTSLVKWMTDEAKVSTGDLVRQLDDLYIAVLGAITLAIENGSMPASSATMNNLIDIYAPRLSCAQSAAVPTAFQDFWRRSFQPVSGLEYSDDVAGFLQDVLAAVPGLIIVEGLYSDESQSAASERFPHAESVPTQIVDTPLEMSADLVTETQSHPYEEEADDVIDLSLDDAASPHPTEVEVPNVPIDYDADVSQTQQTQLETRKRKSEVLIDTSPSSADSPDVFGPRKQAKQSKSSRRHKRSKMARRSRESTSHVGDETVIPGTDIEDEEPTPSRPSAKQAHSNESMLGRFLRRVPTIGAFFTERVPASYEPASYEIEDTDVDEDEGTSRSEPISEIGNNTYDELVSHQDIEMEQSQATPSAAEGDAAPEVELEEGEGEARPSSSTPPVPATRKARAKQSTPSLEPTQTDSVPSSQHGSRRRRSRRVAVESPAEVRTTRSRKGVSVGPSAAGVAAAPKHLAADSTPEVEEAQPGSPKNDHQTEDSQRATRSSSRRKRASDSVDAMPAKRLRSTAPAPTAPSPPERSKDARVLRRERRQRAAKAASAEHRENDVEVPTVAREPEVEVLAEAIETEPVAEPEEVAEPADLEGDAEPTEAELDAEDMEREPVLVEEMQVEAPAVPEPGMESEIGQSPDLEEGDIEIEGMPAEAPVSAVVELPQEEPADHTAEVPCAFLDAPSVIEGAPVLPNASVDDTPDRSEAIPSAFMDAPTPVPAPKAAPAPVDNQDDILDEDEEEVERLVAQNRLLGALEEVVADEALAHLDLTGINAVLAYARRLQDAAMATLAAFARDGEAGRRRARIS
ncbi:unnamed protein product [Cutaneotrichosporon oleaginosum]